MLVIEIITCIAKVNDNIKINRGIDEHCETLASLALKSGDLDGVEKEDIISLGAEIIQELENKSELSDKKVVRLLSNWLVKVEQWGDAELQAKKLLKLFTTLDKTLKYLSNYIQDFEKKIAELEQYQLVEPHIEKKAAIFYNACNFEIPDLPIDLAAWQTLAENNLHKETFRHALRSANLIEHLHQQCSTNVNVMYKRLLQPVKELTEQGMLEVSKEVSEEMFCFPTLQKSLKKAIKAVSEFTARLDEYPLNLRNNLYRHVKVFLQQHYIHLLSLLGNTTWCADFKNLDIYDIYALSVMFNKQANPDMFNAVHQQYYQHVNSYFTIARQSQLPSINIQLNELNYPELYLMKLDVRQFDQYLLAVALELPAHITIDNIRFESFERFDIGPVSLRESRNQRYEPVARDLCSVFKDIKGINNEDADYYVVCQGDAKEPSMIDPIVMSWRAVTVANETLEVENLTVHQDLFANNQRKNSEELKASFIEKVFNLFTGCIISDCSIQKVCWQKEKSDTEKQLGCKTRFSMG